MRFLAINYDGIRCLPRTKMSFNISVWQFLLPKLYQTLMPGDLSSLAQVCATCTLHTRYLITKRKDDSGWVFEPCNYTKVSYRFHSLHTSDQTQDFSQVPLSMDCNNPNSPLHPFFLADCNTQNIKCINVKNQWLDILGDLGPTRVLQVTRPGPELLLMLNFKTWRSSTRRLE